MKNRIKANPPVGIIGGVGPFAGLDFVKKIFSNTLAVKDQDHINCILVSCPSVIPDRTGYLLQNDRKDFNNGMLCENPAIGMYDSALRLYDAGVRYAAVACNTAHSNKIFSPFLERVNENIPEMKIINMLETTSDFIKETKPQLKCIGLLATKGTYKSRVYCEYFRKEDGFELIEPEIRGQDRIHEAIYSETFGIKANSVEIKPQAHDMLSYEIYRFIDRGAEAVILGCTELPLAISALNYTIPVIDPGLIISRKLIQLASPEKLIPLN